MKDNKLTQVVHLVCEEQHDSVHIRSIQDKEEKHDVMSIEISDSSGELENFTFIKEIGCKVPNLLKLTRLNLSHNNLGVVPLCLYILKLERLDLSHNSLKKAPDCLFKGLETLRVLNLGHNKLGKFEQPLCVRNLESLDISYCHFNNPPEWFFESRAVKLHTFIYNGNSANLKSHEPPTNHFKKLEMQNCKLNDEANEFLRKIRSVHELNLGNERNAVMNGFCKIRSLFSGTSWQENVRVLKLNNLGLAYLPDCVNCFKRLEELHLESNWLTTLPDEIGELTELKLLNLCKNILTKFPETFGNLQNLLTLQASFNTLIKVDLKSLRLTYLDLYNNEIEEIKVNCLVKCLDLDMNYLKNPSEVCDDYEAKKMELRKQLEQRTNGCKADDLPEVESCSTCSTSSLDSFYDTVNCGSSTDYYSINCIPEESWDVDIENFQDVSLSDNEYQGNKHKTVINKKTNNYSCEDYLYEDAD